MVALTVCYDLKFLCPAQISLILLRLLKVLMPQTKLLLLVSLAFKDSISSSLSFHDKTVGVILDDTLPSTLTFNQS